MMSPKVLEVDNLIFCFHSYDALHENRASVHVEKRSQNDHKDAKIWLEPKVEVMRAGKTLRTHELNKVLKIVEQDLEYLLEEWHGYKRKTYGSSDIKSNTPSMNIRFQRKLIFMT